MRRILSSLSVLVVLGLSGCASSQGNLAIKDTKKVEQIKMHQSTKDDVRNILGKPDSVMTQGNGNEMWTYTYTNADGSGMMKKGAAAYGINLLIPGLGGAIGAIATTHSGGHNNSGIKHEYRSLRLTFNSSGVLIDKVYSSGGN